MTIYFCINDLLDELEKIENPQDRKNHLVSVALEKPSCGGHPEDVFSLISTPALLDLNGGDAHYQLANLLETVPLYHINLQLILDEILAERHKNASVMEALRPVFANGQIPETVETSSGHATDATGDLRHPALQHFGRLELCRIYISFLNNLSHDRDLYGFEKNILGRHQELFLKHMDGYIGGDDGKIKASILIGFGMRQDHKPYNDPRPMESYVRDGKIAAAEMKISEPHEFLWAWLEAEAFQIRRCRDIHRLFTLENYQRVPNWVRSDLLQIISKEAMKEFFAAKLFGFGEAEALLANLPETRKAMEINLTGDIDPALHQLISETFRPDFNYSGGAGKFLRMADIRMGEAKAARIS